jgi:hypothetical protein
MWLVLKQAESRKELLLPVSLFGLHLFLGNWWNGEPTKRLSFCARVQKKFGRAIRLH